MIVLDNVLQIWIELIKYRNDDAGEKFYLVQFFQKFKFWSKFRKFRKIKKMKKCWGAPLLYELSERESG